MNESIRSLLVLGASGDLAGRLLLPALGQLMSNSQGPGSLHVVGAGTEQWDDAAWRERVRQSFETVSSRGKRVDNILSSTTYVVADVTQPDQLQRLLDSCDRAPAIYFALPPAVTTLSCKALSDVQLPQGTALVLEKPFGTNEARAAELDALVATLVPEDQIHRVDHFLGKSTVLNLLGLRFSNRLFEFMWSAEHIEKVDIVFDESLGLENRARYYDGAGALVEHDPVAPVAGARPHREGPSGQPQRGRSAGSQGRCLRACRIWGGDAASASRRAGYTAGTIEGRELPGYVQEQGVDPQRNTETLAEVTLEVELALGRGAVPSCCPCVRPGSDAVRPG